MHGSERLHEMRGLEGVGGWVVWLHGSKGLHEMRVMRGGGLSTPSGVVGLRINVKMTFTRN